MNEPKHEATHVPEEGRTPPAAPPWVWESGTLPANIVEKGPDGDVELRSYYSNAVATLVLEDGRVAGWHGWTPEVLWVLFPEVDLEPGQEVIRLARVFAEDEENVSSEDIAVGMDAALQRASQLPRAVEAFRRVDLPALAVLEPVTNGGLQIDVNGLDDEETQLLDEMLYTRREVEKHLPGVNPLKEEQAERFLQTVTPWNPPEGMPPPYDDELPRLTHLERLAEQDERVDLVRRHRHADNRWRQLSALASTRIETGRLHVPYHPGFASSTGRMHMSGASCLSSLPADYRRFVVADEGEVFVVSDYSAFEFRTMGALAGEERILTMRKDADPHREFAAVLFESTSESVSAAQRRVAKTLAFAMAFGMGQKSIARNVGTRFDVPALVRRYEAEYPKLHRFLDSLTQGDAFVDLPSGRVLHLGDGDDDTLRRRRVAYTVQGTAADIAKIALINVHKALTENHLGHVAIFLHDEIVAQVPEDKAEEASELIKVIMETPPEWLPNVPLSVTPEIRKSWGA